MTREEAINKLIRIRQLQGGKSEAHEALGMAIDALAYQAELPEGLEEAAMSYYLADIQHPGHYDEDGKPYPKAINDAFIAGSEYQRKQDQSLIELAEEHAMLAGMNKMKEQMGKQAREQLAKDEITLADLVAFDEGFSLGRRLERQDMMKKAIGGRYMKADGKVYVDLEKEIERCVVDEDMNYDALCRHFYELGKHSNI